jgi:adenylate cyclase
MADDRTKRRLAAILAADVVGYSKLMGQDEAGTLALKAIRVELIDPKIAEHSGRVLKTTGDGTKHRERSYYAVAKAMLNNQRPLSTSPPLKT